MQRLKKCIQDKTQLHTQDIYEQILSMISQAEDLVPLSSSQLFNALELEGEFLVLRLNYDDFTDAVQNEIIKYQISQSLSVIVSYEEDGSAYEKIEEFIQYIYANTDEKQNSIFGVKKVKELSEYPIRILFSGILPINQLQMSIGKKIDELIHSDEDYFKPRFSKFRDDISQEVGIPILPVLPKLDTKLDDYQVRLVDMYDGRVISEFGIPGALNKETVEIYLLKLFYIYKVLVEEKKCASSH